MPVCRSGPRYQRARGNAGLWSKCGCEVIPSACRLKTSRLATNATLIDGLSFCARYADSIAPRAVCVDNGRYPDTQKKHDMVTQHMNDLGKVVRDRTLRKAWHSSLPGEVASTSRRPRVGAAYGGGARKHSCWA